MKLYFTLIKNFSHIFQALCTVGNGVFALRGAGTPVLFSRHNFSAPESKSDDTHYPATYIAGFWNRAISNIDGNKVENEVITLGTWEPHKNKDLVNFPNGMHLTFRRSGGDWLKLTKENLIKYEQTFNVKDGAVSRRFQYKDKEGNITSVIRYKIL